MTYAYALIDGVWIPCRIRRVAPPGRVSVRDYIRSLLT